MYSFFGWPHIPGGHLNLVKNCVKVRPVEHNRSSHAHTGKLGANFPVEERTFDAEVFNGILPVQAAAFIQWDCHGFPALG